MGSSGRWGMLWAPTNRRDSSSPADTAGATWAWRSRRRLGTEGTRCFAPPASGRTLARTARPLPLTARTGEVDRVLWTPLHDLTAPGTYREELWRTVHGEHRIVFFELDDETVWGATARMLHQVLRVAHGVPGHEPPAH